MERSNHPLAVKSQNWIIDALLQLLKQTPYKDITVTAICNNADVDRRTFYRNFESKDDILEFHIFCLKDEYIQCLEKVEIRTIHSMSKAQFEFWTRHVAFLTSLHQNNLLTGLLLKTANEFIPNAYGIFHEQRPNNLEYKINFTVGGFCNILIQWIATGAKESPEEIADIVSELFDANDAYWYPYL